MSGITREERNACRRCVREVRARNIDSQLDFRRWALRSHPDKVRSEVAVRYDQQGPELLCKPPPPVYLSVQRVCVCFARARTHTHTHTFSLFLSLSLSLSRACVRAVSRWVHNNLTMEIRCVFAVFLPFSFARLFSRRGVVCKSSREYRSA